MTYMDTTTLTTVLSTAPHVLDAESTPNLAFLVSLNPRCSESQSQSTQDPAARRRGSCYRSGSQSNFFVRWDFVRVTSARQENSIAPRSEIYRWCKEETQTARHVSRFNEQTASGCNFEDECTLAFGWLPWCHGRAYLGDAK